ncbi:MAG: FAD binding domain-containing protein, partial [Myxococcales bacterium]|nr:FAD binding domain-containing protein [Myxococcales bacterium]
MRSYLPAFACKAPASLDEALVTLASEPGKWTPLAGGTDLMVLFESGKLPPGHFLSLWKLPELRGIEVTDDAITLGALTTYAEVREHATVAFELPMLAAAARESGAIAIQGRGTLGGNIMNASPAADSPPALVAYDAEIELVRASGARWVRYRDFHTGYKVMDRAPDEILRRIRIPRRDPGQHWVHFYRKVGTRRFQAITKVGIAAIGRVEGGVARDVRVAFTSVAPTVLAAARTEAALEGQAFGPGLVAAARAA